MIIRSFQHVFVSPGLGLQTSQEYFLDLDFRALYQINPDKLVILKYASIVGLREDATFSAVNDTIMMARLIGNFNETRNITVTPVVPANTTITDFDGITFSDSAPFRAVPDDLILMPAEFQISFRKGGNSQAVLGDNMTTWISIGYDIVEKNRSFQNSFQQ